MLRAAFASLALCPAIAAAGSCPWLSDEDAALAIALRPTEVRVEKIPVFPNKQELLSSTRCRFADAKEFFGHLSVTVMYYGSYDAATAAYQQELADAAAHANPAMIDATPAFAVEEPGASMKSYAVKERNFVIVTHVFSRRVKEAIGGGPGKGLLSTHEVVRRVLAKLQDG